MSTLPDRKDDLAASLMLRTLKGEELPSPFAREIFLLETHIAGTAYYDAAKILPDLATDQTLVLKRRPDNRFDALAVEIHTETGAMLGHVPRDDNTVLARLMDAGKTLPARLVLTGEPPRGPHVELRVRIWLKEF